MTVSVADRAYVKTPSPEDLLLILSVHAAKHVWGRLIWLCDITQIIKRQNLDWDWIQSQSQELGIKRILHITLLLMHRFLLTPMPAPIKDAAIADRAALSFTEQISASIAAGITYEEEKLSYFRLMMRLREPPTGSHAISHAAGFHAWSRRVGSDSSSEISVRFLPSCTSGAGWQREWVKSEALRDASSGTSAARICPRSPDAGCETSLDSLLIAGGAHGCQCRG